MTISALWPLCFLPLIFVIIIFYLLKQPAKEKLLSSLSYWQSIYRQQHSKKPWEKLRQDLLMYLQILTILLLILSLCGPVLHGAKKKERILFVFDTSASMQTLYSVDGTTRLEQAKKEAKKLIESSKSPLEATIISCSDHAQVLLNSSTDQKRIFSALDAIEQQDCEGNLHYATSLCESVYSQWEDGNCIFFTDSSLHTGSLPAQIYDFSTSTAAPKEPLLNSNLFIASLYTSRNERKNSITITAYVGNFGTTFPSSDVNFYINDTLVDIQNYHNTRLNNGTTTGIQSKSISLPEDSSYPLIVKAELQEQDALNADNTAYHIVEKEQKDFNIPRVLLATKQNTFLEKALAAATPSPIEVSLVAPSMEVYKINSMEDYNPKDSYDLFIFDGIFPEKLPKTGSVLLLPNAKHMKASGKAFQELLPEFSYDSVVKNQYLNLIDWTARKELGEIAFPVAKMLSITAPAGAETIFALDDGSVCGYMEHRNHRILTVFGFDLHDSNFPLQTNFPILMYHIFHECLFDAGFFSGDSINEKAGSLITFYPLDAQKKISIRNQYGKEVKSLTPSSSLSATTTLEKCGIYDFYTKSEDYHAYLSVSFPCYDESNILEVPVFSSDTEKESAIAETKVSSFGIPIQKLFIILSLLLLIAEFIAWIRRQWGSFRRHLFFIMRFCLVLLLCLSISDIRITLGKSTETTLFLVDVSDSMKRDLSLIQTSLEQAAHDLPSGSKAGIIAFGSDSRVEQFISRKLHFNGLETTLDTSATNLEQALRTAAYMFSDEDSKRIVLLTDGQENTGIAKNMASTLNDNGISLKVLKFPKEQKEVLVSNLRIPEKLSTGEKFQAEVTVLSNTDTNALISLYSGDTLKSTKQVSLSSGTNRFLFQDTLTKQGINTYRVIVEAEQDTETLNNEYVTFTQADKKQKLLLIEGRKGEAAEFEKILKAGNFSYRKIMPAYAPQKLMPLKNYAVVILENVHADDLPEGFRKLLQSYVSEGGGLIAIGGDNSFALGNYQQSSLDNILPVKSVLPTNEEVPEAAMALVIDHSGSMNDGDKYITRLELAKEAAVSALSSLRETDSIGVLAFDDSYDWVVPLKKVSDSEDIQPAILGIESKGGTSIYPAIAEAVKQLSSYNAKQKHIILLTDGEDSFKDYNDLYQKMEKENITLSTVAVSSGADTKLLQAMAKAGGGRYYYTDISTDIPRIFAQEVFLSSDAYLVNKKFKPVLSGALYFSSNIQQYNDPIYETFTESLYGYVRTSLSRPDSNANSYTLLESDSHDPILAIRNLGLGTTVAFTSDVTNQWTRDYAGLDSYAQFWKNLINSCIVKLDDDFGTNTLSADTENNIAHITYSTTSVYPDNYLERDITAICSDEDGNSVEVPLSLSKDPEAYYLYEADIPLEHTGVYSLVVNDTGTYAPTSIKVKGEEVPVGTESFSDSASTVFASTYSMEYQLYDDDSTIDDLISLTDAELISSAEDFYTGKLIHHAASHSLTPYFLLLVLLLFMADIYIRRFGIPRFLQSLKPFKISLSSMRHAVLTSPLKPQETAKQKIQEEAENPPKTEQKKTMQNEGKQQKKTGMSEKQISKKRIKKKETTELLDTSMLLSSRKQKKR